MAEFELHNRLFDSLGVASNHNLFAELGHIPSVENPKENCRFAVTIHILAGCFHNLVAHSLKCMDPEQPEHSLHMLPYRSLVHTLVGQRKWGRLHIVALGIHT